MSGEEKEEKRKIHKGEVLFFPSLAKSINTGRLFYRCRQYDYHHGTSRRVLAFYAIKLLCSVTR
jgi:hypothetical protein